MTARRPQKTTEDTPHLIVTGTPSSELWAETDLTKWFARVITDLNCRADTQAYIVGVLSAMKHTTNQVDGSLVLTFAEAWMQMNFQQLQRLGDWVLWMRSVCPTSSQDKQLTETIGRRSYERCWKLLRGDWILYQELADRLPELSHQVHAAIYSSSGSFSFSTTRALVKR